MISIKLPAGKALLFLVVSTAPAAPQQNSGNATKPSKPARVYTNDDVGRPRSRYDNDVPEIPGLIKCGEDLDCFLQALDATTPAALTRNEVAEEGTAVVTSDSTWWTTKFAGGRCTVSFRVDSLDAKINEKVVPANSRAARGAVEGKLEQMKRDFASIRGQIETCTLEVKDLKFLMTSSAWSLMALGPVSNFGKNCSGPAFDALQGPLSTDKK